MTSKSIQSRPAVFRIFQSGLPLRSAVKACALLLALAVLVLPGLARAQDPDAEAFVQEVAGNAVAILSDETLTRVEQTRAFGDLMTENVALRFFGRSALGPYSRVATEAELERYYDLLEDYAILTIQSRLDDYVGQRVEVTGSQTDDRRPRYVVVSGKILSPEDERLGTFDITLLRNEGIYKIFDVKVMTPGESGTFSLLNTQRSEFVSVISNNGRQVSALLDFLDAQVAEMRTNFGLDGE